MFKLRTTILSCSLFPKCGFYSTFTPLQGSVLNWTHPRVPSVNWCSRATWRWPVLWAPSAVGSLVTCFCQPVAIIGKSRLTSFLVPTIMVTSRLELLGTGTPRGDLSVSWLYWHTSRDIWSKRSKVVSGFTEFEGLTRASPMLTRT